MWNTEYVIHAENEDFDGKWNEEVIRYLDRSDNKSVGEYSIWRHQNGLTRTQKLKMLLKEW